MFSEILALVGPVASFWLVLFFHIWVKDMPGCSCVLCAIFPVSVFPTLHPLNAKHQIGIKIKVDASGSFKSLTNGIIAILPLNLHLHLLHSSWSNLFRGLRPRGRLIWWKTVITLIYPELSAHHLLPT